MIYVGTAGWSIPAPRQQDFPPGSSHLQRYAMRLNAAEINSSFHRHHRPATYARWVRSVPEHFRFCAKIPRALTHSGDLVAVEPTLDRFVTEVSALEHKLGALLVQLPPKLVFDAAMVERFFLACRRRLDVSYVCEPRHPSWGSPEADAVLTSCGVSRVAADPPPWPGAGTPGGDDGIVYFRWHGQPRKYYSDYDAASLDGLRTQVMAAASSASVWVIFDNTVLGHALGNALNISDALASR